MFQFHVPGVPTVPGDILTSYRYMTVGDSPNNLKCHTLAVGTRNTVPDDCDILTSYATVGDAALRLTRVSDAM